MLFIWYTSWLLWVKLWPHGLQEYCFNPLWTRLICISSKGTFLKVRSLKPPWKPPWPPTFIYYHVLTVSDLFLGVKLGKKNNNGEEKKNIMPLICWIRISGSTIPSHHHRIPLFCVTEQRVHLSNLHQQQDQTLVISSGQQQGKNTEGDSWLHNIATAIEFRFRQRFSIQSFHNGG